MKPGEAEERNAHEEQMAFIYGDDAFCYDCRAVGEKIGKDYSYDVLHCTECPAEWVAVPHGYHFTS